MDGAQSREIVRGYRGFNKNWRRLHVWKEYPTVSTRGH